MTKTLCRMASETMTPEPEVELLQYFERPYDLSVATARTCYSSKVKYPEEMDKTDRARNLRDRIAKSIYEAGHHTTIQHPTFSFVLKRVSRQFIWSFLHSHTFYNSEQVSQRYVPVKKESFVTPPLSDEGREIYRSVIERQMAVYGELRSLLHEPVAEEYFKLYPGRARQREKWERPISKRVMEMARYILPVATTAHLYHTISGVTLHRYNRLCQAYDVPCETRQVIRAMVRAVDDVDPLFFKEIEDPLPLEETPEYHIFNEFHDTRPAPADFIREFDDSFGPWRFARLIDHKPNAEAVMAQAVRTVFGLTRDRMTDAEAIGRVMDPSKNTLLAEALNLTSMSKLCRTMVHPHFTFRKRLSHTADSQAQRHRTVPGSRPVLRAQIDPTRPDYILPEIVARVPEARDLFRRTMDFIWEGMGRLLELGIPTESVHYLLPNATPIRYEESGDLAGLHHKWRLRLCYLAQEEIWRSSREEVLQVREVHPQIGKYVGPPCLLRKMADETPYCPEGDRFCGVPVWNLDVDEYERVI